jgi:hypothetical protein
MTNPVTRAGAKSPPDITCNDALSGGSARTFAESVPVQEPAVERVSRGAKEKLKETSGLVNFQKQIEQSAFQGMEFAAAYGLRAPKDLDALLARDASFRDRFQNDLAFQEGVRAMVWLGQNNSTEFEARLALFVSQKAATTSTAARPLQ